MGLEDARGRMFGDMDVKNMNLQQAESMLELIEATLVRTLNPCSQMIQDYALLSHKVSKLQQQGDPI
jgi:hypothetical protein